MPADDEYPDPTKYLFISLEQKRKDQAKPYDGKKMFWIPDDKDCYVLGNIVEEKGDMVTMGDLPGGEKVCNSQDSFYVVYMTKSHNEFHLWNNRKL